LFVIKFERLVGEPVVQSEPDSFQHYHLKSHQDSRGQVPEKIGEQGSQHDDYAHIQQRIQFTFFYRKIFKII